MNQAEFFKTSNAYTERLNIQGKRVHNSIYDGHNWDEIRSMRTEYMKAIIDSGDPNALKYAIFAGMENSGGRDGYPDTSQPIHDAVELLSSENPEFSDKFSGMLARLIDPVELPPIDPEHDTHWRPGEQQDYRYYTTMLLHSCSMQPRSAALFEAGYRLLTSGDPRIHGHDVYQSTRFSDRLLWSLLVNHQTDRRLQKTWEAALRQEGSQDDDCLYPEPMKIYPLQAFNGMINLPNDEGKKGMPADLLIPSIEMLIEGAGKVETDKQKPLDVILGHAFFVLLWELTPEDEANTRRDIKAHFADNITVISALDNANPNKTTP